MRGVLRRPIVASVAAIALGTAAGFVLIDLAGRLIALAIGLVLYNSRRRRGSTCVPAPEVVQVEPPRMRIT